MNNLKPVGWWCPECRKLMEAKTIGERKLGLMCRCGWMLPTNESNAIRAKWKRCYVEGEG